MEEKESKQLSLDILKHLEDISVRINKMMSGHAEGVLRRYPVTFGLLILLGVIILNEGLKGILRQIGLYNLNPWLLLFTGLLVLALTGKLYQKLDK